MILIAGFLIVVFVTIVAIMRSKKPLSLILAEARYELVYNAIGSKALIEDLVMRGKNRTDLPLQSGKVVVITGGSRGIGLEVVKMLLKCDIHVVIGCRNPQTAELLLSKCRDEEITTGDVTAFKLDISFSESVKKFAKTVGENFPKINCLINNAGIMFGPYIESRDGYESQFSTNYLGHFLLTHLLLPQLIAGGTKPNKSRVINVSSCAHLVGEIDFEDINSRNRYIPAEAYAQSKLAQVLFTHYLEALCEKEDLPVQAHSVHPGIVNTDLFNGTHLKNLAPWIPALMFKSPEQGAIPIVHACLSPKLEGKGGTYIHNCRIHDTSQSAKSEQLQEKLFKFTKDLLKIEDFGGSENNNTKL